MSNLSDVHTVEELVEFISEFIQTVPTQNDYDNLKNQMLTKDVLGALVAKLVYRSEFSEALSAMAKKSDVIQQVASKAEQSDVLSGMVRKADRSSVYALEAKVNRLFPYEIVDNITERNRIPEADRSKIVMVLDASADPQLSNEATGAMYGWSKTQSRWILLSEIKYTGDQIKYNAILGRPSSSAQEIDTVVNIVQTNASIFRKIREIFTSMHIHGATPAQIDNAVDKAHSHIDIPEVFNVVNTDMITLIRDGQLVNVKASVLKSYLEG